MALNPLTGAATVTVKVADFNALITALNTELASLDERLDVVERQTAAVLPSSIQSLADTINSLGARTVTLENEPDPVIPPDLTDRVAALENMVQRAPAEDPTPSTEAPALPKPANLDPARIETVYDRVTLYYHDLELYAQRLGENRWRLYASLNYIVISPAVWTYDEIVDGTADEVYQHAMARLQELARLKPAHDAVHDRVREMSEGSAPHVVS